MGAASTRFVAAMTGDPAPALAPGPALARTRARPAYGVALLSRYPLVGWRDLHLPRIAPPVPRLRRHPRRVELAHEERRAAVIARIETPEGPLLVASAHLSFFPGWNQLQLYALRRALTSAGGPARADGRPEHDPAARPGRSPASGRSSRADTFPWTRPTVPDRPRARPRRRGRGRRRPGRPAADVRPPGARRRARPVPARGEPADEDACPSLTLDRVSYADPAVVALTAQVQDYYREIYGGPDDSPLERRGARPRRPGCSCSPGWTGRPSGWAAGAGSRRSTRSAASARPRSAGCTRSRPPATAASRAPCSTELERDGRRARRGRDGPVHGRGPGGRRRLLPRPAATSTSPPFGHWAEAPGHRLPGAASRRLTRTGGTGKGCGAARVG